MNFIDWNNEWAAVYNKGYKQGEDLNESPIAGMSLEVFNQIIMEEFERIEYEQQVEVEKQNCLPEEHISKIQKMKMGKSSKDCYICQSDFVKGVIIMKLPCKHIFHEGCIVPWFQKQHFCPNCRFDIREYFQNK
ncbi:hypothetical protein pb186bvf_006624 [Paramecium bursaria]